MKRSPSTQRRANPGLAHYLSHGKDFIDLASGATARALSKGPAWLAGPDGTFPRPLPPSGNGSEGCRLLDESPFCTTTWEVIVMITVYEYA